ncbi:Uncharacterized protein dnm_016930 [Desulfonema magnum]|uniref:Uncharacterized protein n=1 Tax=Desulfonema magnum TaxID=45655 RepID=A0A975GLI6_9BACT|nr:Uncharacterized protein dnm_016930 [Desulfonema magnum]
MRFEMVSPRPVAIFTGCGRICLGEAVKNQLFFSGGMPIPVSRTENSNAPGDFPSGSFFTSTQCRTYVAMPEKVYDRCHP